MRHEKSRLTRIIQNSKAMTLGTLLYLGIPIVIGNMFQYEANMRRAISGTTSQETIEQAQSVLKEYPDLSLINKIGFFGSYLGSKHYLLFKTDL